MKNDDFRICFIGDSFVNGTGDPECLGWTGRVVTSARRKGYNLSYYNLGVRRETSSDIVRRWLDETKRRLPEDCRPFIVLSFGVNDTTLENGHVRVAETQSIENAQRIFIAAKSIAPALMIGPPPVADAEQNERIGRLSILWGNAAEKEDVPFLSVFESLSRDEIWMSEVSAGDGSHPGAASYARLAALVEAWPNWWFH